MLMAMLQHDIAFKKGYDKSLYIVATEALSTHSLIDLEMINKQLEKPCGQGGRNQTCLDVFRADVQIVRVWRVMWRSLPAAIRREKLLEMLMPSWENTERLARVMIGTTATIRCWVRLESDVIVDWENGKQNQAVIDRSCYAM